MKDNKALTGKTTGTISNRREEVAHLHGEGLSAREIGTRLNVSHVTILRDQKALGLPPSNGHKPASMGGHYPVITSPLASWTDLQSESVEHLRRQAQTSSGAASALARFAASRVKDEAEDNCADRHADIDEYNALVLLFWNTTTNRMLGPLVRRVTLELQVDRVRVEAIVSEIIEDVAQELNALNEARAAKLDAIEARQAA